MVQDESRSTIVQIIDTGNDIGSQVEFFPEISVDGGQNFEFFHASERVFNDYFEESSRL